MNRIAMSSAAAALLRALTERAHVARDRTLLTDAESVDWRSLTFTDERHVSADRRILSHPFALPAAQSGQKQDDERCRARLGQEG